MSKFITYNKKEAKQNPDLIYLEKRILNTIVIKEVKRCDNELCRRVLPYEYQLRDDDGERYTTYLKYKGKNYCDKYCSDEYVKTKLPSHFCKTCNEPVESFKYTKDYRGHKKGSNIGVYPKYCDKCSPYSKREKQQYEEENKSK